MQSRRFVLVGTRVERAEVLALLEAARATGLDVRAAAQRPPERAWGEPGPQASGRDWHRVPPLPLQPGVGGLLGAWVTRAVRGAATPFAEQLSADPWLGAQLVDDPGGVLDPAEVLLVALDDTAAQALARWRTERAATVGGRPVPVLTWDQGAETIAEEIAQRRAATGVPGEGPGGSTDAGSLAPLPAGEDDDPQARRPVRPLGARHTLTILAGGDGSPRHAVRHALSRGRTAVTLVDLDVVPDPDLGAADAVVLDGLGPGVVLLDRWPGTRVVHLRRATDRRSPWRHLLPPGRVEPVAPEVVEALVRGDADAVDEVLAAALHPAAVRLMRVTAEHGDPAALAVAEELIRGELPPDPAVLRELAFLTKVTGSLHLERQLLERQLALPDPPAELLHEALERVGERLRETEPGWLPDLPSSPVEPAPSLSGTPGAVPGTVLHLLKVTLPQRQAGYSVRGHQTLRALVETGVEVVAVAAPQALEEPAGPDLPPAVRGQVQVQVQESVLDGVRYLTLPPVPGGGPTALLEQQARAVLDVVRAERPSVLHVHSGGRGYDLGIVGAAVARATGLPWVYEVRGLFESLWTTQSPRAERGETFERRMAREAELVTAADAAVTLAETMRADLVARGVEREHVVVVPNAVDPDGLVPSPRDDALAERWGTVGAFTFGYVSNLDHAREQVEDLIRAAVILRDLGLRVRALIVGDGSRRERLEETARRLGAQDVVVFTGRVPHEEVAASYALLDVLVVPRSDERAARLVTPLKPYEAMAMGLPVVVSAQPALLEVIAQDERGWSYPAGDAPALARLLQQLAADPARRAAVAARARDWVLAERTWTANAQRYAEVYRCVLKGRASTTG